MLVFYRQPLHPACHEKMYRTRLRLDQHTIKATQGCGLFSRRKQSCAYALAVLIGGNINPVQQ